MRASFLKHVIVLLKTKRFKISARQLKKAQLEKAMEATPDEQRRADLAWQLGRESDES